MTLAIVSFCFFVFCFSVVTRSHSRKGDRTEMREPNVKLGFGDQIGLADFEQSLVREANLFLKSRDIQNSEIDSVSKHVVKRRRLSINISLG